jgi:hypothetical protein
MHRRRFLGLLTASAIVAPTLTARAQSRWIANSQFTVEPGTYQYFSFQLNDATTRIYGKYRAQGGSRNDIICALMDADNFENFRNGNEYRAYYLSPRQTVGTVDVRLGPGDYRLIFSNTFSIVSNKVVSASIGVY